MPFKAVYFLQHPHKRHPIARPWGRGVGCLLWVHPLSMLCPSRCSVVNSMMLHWTALYEHLTVSTTTIIMKSCVNIWYVKELMELCTYNGIELMWNKHCHCQCSSKHVLFHVSVDLNPIIWLENDFTVLFRHFWQSIEYIQNMGNTF